MCGRFTLYSDVSFISEFFSVTHSYDFNPSYNVAPSQNIPVICQLPTHENVVVKMRWGLIPSWQKAKAKAYNTINARIETITTKPSYRHAIIKRRCIIIANGYYEWKLTTNGIKQPYYFQNTNQTILALAGIWERNISDKGCIDSCCIITVPSNDQTSIFHDRMPAILDSSKYNVWLDSDNENWESLKHLIISDSIPLNIYPVSTKVNSPRYNSPECIKHIIL